MYVYMHTYTYIYTHVCITHRHIHMYAYTYVCVCVYMCPPCLPSFVSNTQAGWLTVACKARPRGSDTLLKPL